MTSSAPSPRTMSIFFVLHTPVTCAPRAFASCTANGPTLPDAPLISTLCPGAIPPRRPQALQGQDRCLRQSRRFLIAHAARLVCPGPLRSDCVLCEGAMAELRHVPKHRITRLESSDVLANRLNVACCVK